MRHSHVRLKKSLQDCSAELEHARSRAEQYEMEVKKLRCRIEELKSELSSVEDEVHELYLLTFLCVSLFDNIGRHLICAGFIEFCPRILSTTLGNE